MNCRLLRGEFSVCQLASAEGIDFSSPLLFFARTGEEFSLVCPSSLVPSGCLKEEAHWRGFWVEGPLDFELTGILARLSSQLAEAGIPLFAVSTYMTDYIFVKADRLEAARRTLEADGMVFLPPLY
ncbi:MAG: ACT domain-containing protein [Clostridiales bacterium]|nr:ACT domain-containing protein [Clostridiales bacterium]